MDSTALRPKLYPVGLFRTVTSDDDTQNLPAVNTFVLNPDRAFDWCRVFARVYFHGDADATANLRFAVGVQDGVGGVSSAMELKGWLVEPIGAFGVAADLTPDTPVVADGSHQHQTPSLAEGCYAIDVPVYGMDLWVAVSGFSGYDTGYATPSTVELAACFFNKATDRQ